METLGLKVMAETYREARKSYKLDLRVGDTCQIELFSFPDPPPRVSRPEACGLRHIAFEVDSVEKVAQYLTSRGLEVEPIRVDESTQKRFTFLADPDGLPIEIYEK